MITLGPRARAAYVDYVDRISTRAGTKCLSPRVTPYSAKHVWHLHGAELASTQHRAGGGDRYGPSLAQNEEDLRRVWTDGGHPEFRISHRSLVCDVGEGPEPGPQLVDHLRRGLRGERLALSRVRVTEPFETRWVSGSSFEQWSKVSELHQASTGAGMNIRGPKVTVTDHADQRPHRRARFGSPTAAACLRRRLRRTRCIATRWHSWLTVVQCPAPSYCPAR
jgi:hypothetical protein